jgi:hypothetical protein
MDERAEGHGFEGEAFNLQSKKLILNVNDFWEDLKRKAEADPNFCISNQQLKNAVENTKNCLKIAKSSVCKIRKEGKQDATSEPLKPTGRPPIVLSVADKATVRIAFFELYQTGIYPTVKRMKEKIFEKDPNFPTLCNRTLRKMMKSMGFRYRKRNKTWYFCERHDIQVQRIEYLIEKKKLEQQGYYWISQDETWVSL